MIPCDQIFFLKEREKKASHRKASFLISMAIHVSKATLRLRMEKNGRFSIRYHFETISFKPQKLNVEKFSYLWLKNY